MSLFFHSCFPSTQSCAWRVVGPSINTEWMGKTCFSVKADCSKYFVSYLVTFLAAFSFFLCWFHYTESFPFYIQAIHFAFGKFLTLGEDGDYFPSISVLKCYLILFYKVTCFFFDWSCQPITMLINETDERLTISCGCFFILSGYPTVWVLRYLRISEWVLLNITISYCSWKQNPKLGNSFMI